MEKVYSAGTAYHINNQEDTDRNFIFSYGMSPKIEINIASQRLSHIPIEKRIYNLTYPQGSRDSNEMVRCIFAYHRKHHDNESSRFRFHQHARHKKNRPCQQGQSHTKKNKQSYGLPYA